MYLKEVEIFGFKSFPEKVNLKYEPGITVIVGPNGCGKSNILDGIKWALGDQSPRSLRGTKMEDVIFNGTERYPPLNYTEVTLNFSNEDKYLPIDYKEVSITRRLYRSGESQYFINKNIARLKDIVDLFLGTGIGESTYSFVEQGKIEVFLSYKPEEKRQIFDEASGVLKYKESRREALKKLEETDDNLVRLEDIISEVRRQIKYLERQVERARQYKEFEGQLIEVEKNIAGIKLADLDKKSLEFQGELSTLKEREDDQIKIFQSAKNDFEITSSQLKNVRNSLEEIHSQIISFRAQKENAEGYINVHQRRIDELKARNIFLDDTSKNLAERFSLLECRVDEEKRKLTVIEDNLSRNNAEINNFQTKLKEAENEIEKTNRHVLDEKTKILEWESIGVTIRNGIVEAQTHISTLLKRKQRLLLDKARLEGMVKEKKENLEIVKGEYEQVHNQLAEAAEKKNTLGALEQDILNKRENLKNLFVEKEKEMVELKAHYEFVKDLRIKYETFSAKKMVTLIFDDEPTNINKLIVSLKDVPLNKEGNSYRVVVEAKVVYLEESELEGKIKVLKEEIEFTKIHIDNTEKERHAVSCELAVHVKLVEDLDRKGHKKYEEKESLNKEWRRLYEEFELVGSELDIAVTEIADLERKQKTLEENSSNYDNNLQTAQSSLHTAQQNILKYTAIIKEADIETAKKEEQKQSLYKENEGIYSKISLLNEEKETIANNLKDIGREKDDNQAKTASLCVDIDNLKVKIAEYDKSMSGYNLKKEELEEELLFLEKTIEEKNNLIQSLSKVCDEIRNTMYSKKMDLQGLEYEKEKIKDYLRQVYSLELDGLTISAGDNLETLLENKEKLKRRLESLGEVNVVAIEECKELQDREDFLQKQKDDLMSSKENLKKAIQKINATCKEVFLDTFNRIAEEFKKNFKFLFGGGKSHLILLDEENILESGVEIEVQPPGKKLQNVSLLSGGEKALTAISLIFAIFRVKPSPLCVLDEIDAPLDEANVDRFNQLVKEFSSLSQFIVITHNKKTMSNADVLYGITMQERGVSKIVSVKFASQEDVPSPAVSA